MESVFKSTQLRDRFRAAYDQILRQFPFERQYVDTALGRTFVLAYGQKANPPVILLHGSCSNSAFWFPEIMALSQMYMVYAVDIIGEAGNSEEYRPALDTDAFACWLGDVLAALGLAKVNLVGNSLGGWMALKFATAFPEKVSKLVLIASAGLAPIRRQFLLDAEHARQTGGVASNGLDTIGEPGIPPEVRAFMNLILESYDPIQELPTFSDSQLLRLSMPVLFIDGEADAIIDAQASAQRLQQLQPAATVRLLPDTGHMVTGTPAYIIPFLN